VLRVTLTRGYFRSARRLLKPRTSAARKVAATLQNLGTEPVPAEDDVEDFLPPVLPCWARRVPGTALAIMFDRRNNEVRVLALRLWP
jgi:hypothetical protein